MIPKGLLPNVLVFKSKVDTVQRSDIPAVVGETNWQALDPISSFFTRSNSYGDFHNISPNILMLIWTIVIYWGIVDLCSREAFIHIFGPRAPLPGHVLVKGGIWILKAVFVLSCVMLCFVFRMRENKLYFLLRFLHHY